MAHARARRRAMPYEAAQQRPLARGAFRAGIAWILWFVAVANAAVIVWLWLQGGGISAVHNPGTLFTSIGRITGLLGAYLLLIQILLLARLAFLEPLLGFDRLTVWHRLNGKVCLYLVLAHVAFITAGYTLTDRIPLTSEISTLWNTYPGMVTATVGTVLIVLVVVTSLVIVRQRLRYEAWYLVHLLVYLGVLLSWFHQIPTGNEFITNKRAAAYWTALYLVTVVLLGLFRFLQPAVTAFRYRMRVAEVIQESPGTVSLRITGHDLDRLGAQAGQFFLWRFLSRGHWWESHPFSLSAAPDGRSLRITVKNSGDFTNRMGNIKVGTRVLAEGPFGVFTDAVRKRDRAAMIAGGIGITPIRALLEEMRGDLVLVYRVMRDEDIIFHDELERLSRDRGIVLHYVVGDHRAPGNERLLSPEHLKSLVPDITQRDVYICGPPAMMEIIERNVRRADVPGNYIHSERFAL